MNFCKICGKETKNKVFCSIECKAIAQSHSKNKCPICGKTIKRTEMKYCSKICYSKARKAKNTKKIIYNKCIICGKETKNPKYCSMKCLGKDESRKATAINNLPNEHKWIQKEIDFLENNYGKININVISKTLGINKNAIIAFCSKNNIVSQKKWHKKEREYLLEHCNDDIEELSKTLNKSKSSIINQFSKLNGFSDYEGKSLISPQNFIYNFLIENFDLPVLNNIPIGKYTSDILIYKLDIEIQGTYWHNDPRFIEEDIDNHRKNDAIKKEFLEKEGFTIYYIWEYDIYSNPQKVKNLLEEKIYKYLNSLTQKEKEDILNLHKTKLLQIQNEKERKIESLQKTLEETNNNLKILGWPNSNV